jgi:dTDP-4-dehydrorhamnose 3,5-epimerase
MKFERLSIPDIILIKPSVIEDNRGHFSESFRLDLFEKELGNKINFVQDNESKSSKHTLRGLHYQIPPFSQSKLVRVLQGKVLDVAVDLRKSSSYFGKHISIELSEINKNQIFIPHGFAHGFVVLSDSALLSYKVDNYFSKDHDRGIFFDDKNLSIDWQVNIKNILVSQKDKKQPQFNKAFIFE